MMLIKFGRAYCLCGNVGFRHLNPTYKIGDRTAIAQPRMTFAGEDLYPTIVDKASALEFSIVMNHPFVDGNKRTGHAAMETFLVLNGLEINAYVDEQERVILALASGELKRDMFTNWLQRNVVAS